jgi:hypothetical protein
MAAILLVSVAVIVLTIFAFARAVADLRAGRKLWGGIGLAVAGLGLVSALIPIPSHAIKIDIPAAGR